MNVCLGWNVDRVYNDRGEFPWKVEGVALHHQDLQMRRAGVGQDLYVWAARRVDHEADATGSPFPRRCHFIHVMNRETFVRGLGSWVWVMSLWNRANGIPSSLFDKALKSRTLFSRECTWACRMLGVGGWGFIVPCASGLVAGHPIDLVFGHNGGLSSVSWYSIHCKCDPLRLGISLPLGNSIHLSGDCNSANLFNGQAASQLQH